MEQLVSSFSRVIYLLGTLRLQDVRGPRTLGGEKPQSLLAYLVLHPGYPHPRERLADLLFPEASFDRIRRNFSDTRYRVHKTLVGGWLII